jgi:regulator of protease activity HflC (stomatin/prohibitin superfamily)
MMKLLTVASCVALLAATAARAQTQLGCPHPETNVIKKLQCIQRRRDAAEAQRAAQQRQAEAQREADILRAETEERARQIAQKAAEEAADNVCRRPDVARMLMSSLNGSHLLPEARRSSTWST